MNYSHNSHTDYRCEIFPCAYLQENKAISPREVNETLGQKL